MVYQSLSSPDPELVYATPRSCCGRGGWAGGQGLCRLGPGGTVRLQQSPVLMSREPEGGAWGGGLGHGLTPRHCAASLQRRKPQASPTGAEQGGAANAGSPPSTQLVQNFTPLPTSARGTPPSPTECRVPPPSPSWCRVPPPSPS